MVNFFIPNILHTFTKKQKKIMRKDVVRYSNQFQGEETDYYMEVEDCGDSIVFETYKDGDDFPTFIHLNDDEVKELIEYLLERNDKIEVGSIL